MPVMTSPEVAGPASSNPDLHHIRAAFDPTAAPKAAPVEEAPRVGKIYIAGSTTHAAGGLRAKKARHGSATEPLRTPHLITTLLETPACQVSCGWRHSAIVLDNGDLYVAGNDEHGQLGLGGVNNDGLQEQPTPGRMITTMTKVPSMGTGLRVSQVSCGRSHTAFCCDAGELFSMGLNLYGQLGIGSLTSQSSPRRVPHVGGAAAFVSCGELHTLVLRSDGKALSCGFNDAGRLGRTLDSPDGGEEAICAEWLGALPLNAVAAASSDHFAVVALSAGGAHSALITADGSAYTCGRGEHGQLGHGKEAVEARPNGIEKLPRRVAALKVHKIRRAATGASHTLFLSANGTPFACGCGLYGRLGLGSRENVYVPTRLPAFADITIVQISAGHGHSSFVTDTGKVYLCGDDANGQLGLDGGRPAKLDPVQPPKFASRGDHVNVLGVSCGGEHTAYLLRAVVDAKEDYRADQVAAAASVIEALFRGSHIRAIGDKAAQRRRMQKMHTDAQKSAAAGVIQSGWRMHSSALERERREQLRQLRQLRDIGGEDHWWGRIQKQFDAASIGAIFDAASAAKHLTKATW